MKWLRKLKAANGPAARFLKKATALLLIGAATLMTPSYGVVEAQGVNVAGLQVQPFYTQYIGNTVSAVTTDVALYIKYVGATNQAATVAVAAADSDVTLQVAAANDATVNIQSGGLGACGASVGVLDTANANCDTLGELVDHINASANWRAVIVTGLRSDATANTLFTVATTDAKVPDGVAVLWETPQALAINVGLYPVDLNTGASLGIRNWLNRDNRGLVGGSLATRPFADRDSTFLYYSENVTSTGAVGNIIVYCSYDNYVNQGKQVSGTQTDNILFQKAGAATTVTGTVNEFLNAGGLVCGGGRLWVRISATTSLTVPTVVLTGYQRPRRVV